MRLYFSGLSDAPGAAMLQAAGVTSVLADPTDWERAALFPDRALDSGAYRAFKAQRPLTVDDWLATTVSPAPTSFSVMPDVIGDPAETLARWRLLNRVRPDIVPVWQWGAAQCDLDEMLAASRLVGVGGLVRLMRDRHEPTLTALLRLGERFGSSLHIFGLNWPKALNALKPLVRSCDTSKWLDGARYGHVVFVHTKTGKLQAAPARFLGLGHLDRTQRCIQSAAAMQQYFNA